MERDFETVMIEQCAPVLAGLKPAGLFRYETRNRADLARRVAGWNAQLNPKGLQVRVLRGVHRYPAVSGVRLPRCQAANGAGRCRCARLFSPGGLPSAGRCRGLQRAAGPAQPAAVLRGGGGGFPPRDRGYFWAIRWRMWWALSATGASVLPAAGAGSPTATPRRRPAAL